MATVTAFIRTIKTNKNKSINVRFRLRDGRDFQIFHKSDILVLPDKWDEKQQKIKARCLIDEQERKDFDKSISDRKDLIHSIYLQKGKILTSDLLETEIDKAFNPEKYETPQQAFFEAFDEFLVKRKLSDVREKNFMVLKRALQRYELFVSVNERKDYKLELDDITSETIVDFESFLRNEHTLYDEYKDIYDKFPAMTNVARKASKPQPRGTNTINALFNKLRAFFNWCLDTEKTTNRPFKRYESKPDLYGTPIYITIDERNQIYNTDLSNRPSLAIQRDIFVFQCLVGCRVSDLYKFTKHNIINDAIEYIPRKTKGENPDTIRVPLNTTAKEITKRYSSFDEKTLFPYISAQKYNDAIKEIFRISEITRIVTVLNPTTREEEKRPINEIASSHLARRTFCGNLYKKVKDPNLVGKLSGHAEGSKAFARYRDIDENMKKELVSLIE